MSAMIQVMHVQLSAAAAAGGIVVVNGGLIRHAASPLAFFHRLSNTFVPEFIGALKINAVKNLFAWARGGTIAMALLSDMFDTQEQAHIERDCDR